MRLSTLFIGVLVGVAMIVTVISLSGPSTGRAELLATNEKVLIEDNDILLKGIGDTLLIKRNVINGQASSWTISKDTYMSDTITLTIVPLQGGFPVEHRRAVILAVYP